jgi:lysophospholipase L1-like esterase
MIRRGWLAVVVSSALLLGLLPETAGAVTPPPLPASMAAIGDSITQAASSGGGLGTDYPQNSWSTGTNGSVNSHYLRLLSLDPQINGQNHNLSVSGSKVANLNAQMQQAVTLQANYVTVLIGGNDLCTDTVAQMTSVSTFHDQFEQAMTTIGTGSPDSYVYVVSIPEVYHLWELFHDNWWARFIWSVGNVCQSLLADPTSTDPDDVARRAAVAQRNVDYNGELAAVCALHPHCLFDNNAVYNAEFTASDASGDYFHPSIQGQTKLAQVSWEAGYWAAGPPPPQTVSIGDLTGSAATRKGGWTAQVTVLAIDQDGGPVASATVSGSWSTGASGGCTTSAAGSCTFSLNLGKRVTVVTWAVGTITHATRTYDPTHNVESSVSIARP